ncbi:hypothetical protein HOY80DRAFT_997874 [Tuber brumale]|nr:hypothetical protein HOY80DRAFT_997874 [Tuber brumale]
MWSPLAERLMFVGYTLSTRQYKLYNPKTLAIIKSRDVVFYEDQPYFTQTAKQIFLPFTQEYEDSEVSPISDYLRASQAIPKVNKNQESDDLEPVTPQKEPLNERPNTDAIMRKTARTVKQLQSNLGSYWEKLAQCQREIRRWNSPDYDASTENEEDVLREQDTFEKQKGVNEEVNSVHHIDFAFMVNE